MPAPIVIGCSDFPTLREDGAYYVDKSSFVAEILNVPAQVVLYPRPRRFGKTLALSLLQAFFEIGADRSAIFADLAIWSDPSARAHFQRHPVIKLTFKDIKQRTWAEAEAALTALLSAEVERHRTALGDARVPPGLRVRLAEVLERRGDHARVLVDLCEVLAIHHGQKPILLIDEYDAGVLTAWEQGYYEEAVSYFRSLLSPGLKDNPFLFKGVLTGVLRVARESMFSGLNNVQVFSLLHADRDEFFGFTEREVMALLDEFGRATQADEVRSWYNGYRFGETTVYNPLSIMSMLAFPRAPLRAWWLNTSENTLVKSLLLERYELRDGVATLLDGGSIECRVEEDVPIRDLVGENVWGLLLFSGYLKANRVWVERTRTFVEVSIPNVEVRGLWEDTFARWLEDRSGGALPLHDALFRGDAQRVEGVLLDMLLRHVSHHDLASSQDEAFYHAFVLGLLVTLERTHAVRSNREVGLGRADVQLIPKRPGLPGVVIEFKRRRGARPERLSGDLEALAQEALEQIRARAYTVEMEGAGAAPIRRFGIAFSGKDVAVRAE